MDGTVGPPSPAALRDWLSERVAEYLDQPAATVRPDATFPECGLDSMYALMLCADIEDTFGLLIEAETAWAHRTVDALAGYLAGRLGGPDR